MFSDKQYQSGALRTGLSIPTIKAFCSVESSGDGFLSDRRPKILFERHKFYQRLVANRGQAFADQMASQNPSLCNRSPGGYAVGANADLRGQAEWIRLSAAINIDRTSALESASWGAFQVMGLNWRVMGYKSVQDLVNKAYSLDGQMDLLVDFLKANQVIITALKAKNWTSAARQYNGSAQSGYDVKLAAAYKANGGVCKR